MGARHDYSAFIQNGAAENQVKQEINMMICIGPEGNQCSIKKRGGTIVPASDSRPIGLAILLMGLANVFIV